MALAIGTRIGIYEVLGPLGAGGMGEVYRARDTRLGRDVALKILPPAFTADADRVARFTREARLLASLNHPHIGAIYGFEDSPPTGSWQASVPALVLELVEGETLDERVGRGPLPLREVLLIAQQIADALDAAHVAGVVHRDLKPANVMITPEGGLKVLDFGLAKAVDADGSSAEVANAPTGTSDGTRAGVVLGTVAFMSPEQARGKPVDKRTDIWAFGCVLYRLLTGRPAFGGETLSDTIVAILEREPDWTVLPRQTPPGVRGLLRHCLEKDPRRRLRDIGDARRWLDDDAAGPASGSTDATPRRHGVVWLLGGVSLVLASLTGWLLWTAPSALPPPNVQFSRLTDLVGMEDTPAVSPDGKFLAFVFPVDGRRQIWLRQLAGGGAFQRTHDDAHHDHPRWLPDSSAIVYFTPSSKEGEPGTLMEISALVGSPRWLGASTTGTDVSPDGRQIAAFQKTADRVVLAIVPREGTAAGRTIPLEVAPGLFDFTVEFSMPRWSPDGSSIAFVANRGSFSFGLYVADVAGGTPLKVADASEIRGIAWLRDSSGIVYASSSGSTLAYPPVFNLRLRLIRGGPERQLTVGDVSYVHPDIGPAGQLFASRISMQSDIYEFPVSGSPTDNVRHARQITRQTAQVQTPSVSPSGDEIAYLSDNGGHANVWVARIDDSARPRQITNEHDPAVVVGLPLWSPAGDRIVYITRAAVNTQWLMNPDGSDRQEIAQGNYALWSAEGRWLYYHGPRNCIYRVPVPRNGAAAETVLCDADMPIVSVDGKTVYFSQTATNFNVIFKTSLPDGKRTEFARYAPTRLPSWPTGHVLSPDDRWIAVLLKDDATTNIWAIPTDRGPFPPPFRQITDFGRRPVLIARQVSWSKDSKFIYAAVAETDADIVVFEGIVGNRLASPPR